MGKLIDKIALIALIAFIYYLFFIAAFSSIPAACALTFLACALTHRLLSGLKGRWQGSRRFRKRALRARISAMLDDISLSPDPQPQLLPVLNALFPEIAESGAENAGSSTEIVILSRPAACAPLSAETCFDIWQKNRAAERLLIVCTGRVDGQAHILSQTLSAPPMRILGREHLAAALEKHPELVPEAPPQESFSGRKRLRRLHIERKNAPRCLLSGLMLLAMYLVLGNALYLAVSLALLTLAALALRKPRAPEKLF